MRIATAGYSLLEMMIALAIMGMIVVVAAPSVGASVERMTLRSDARALTQELRLLREHALDRQADFAVTVSGSSLNTLIVSDGSTISLASGTRVEIAPTRRGSPAQLLVSWDGRITGAVRVTRGTASAQVSADRLTGRLRAEIAQ